MQVDDTLALKSFSAIRLYGRLDQEQIEDEEIRYKRREISLLKGMQSLNMTLLNCTYLFFKSQKPTQ